MKATLRRAAKVAKTPPGVIRLHEATGRSRTSFEAAVKDAVRSAPKTIGKPIAVEVVKLSAETGARGVLTYRAAVRIGYRQALKLAPKPT